MGSVYRGPAWKEKLSLLLTNFFLFWQIQMFRSDFGPETALMEMMTQFSVSRVKRAQPGRKLCHGYGCAEEITTLHYVLSGATPASFGAFLNSVCPRAIGIS